MRDGSRTDRKDFQFDACKDIPALLQKCGITPTTQRIDLARVLFTRQEHLSAEELFTKVKALGSKVSKATVYNTLALLTAHGLIREVIADPDRVFYDPNVTPHHHFFDTTTGKLMDIPAEGVEIVGLPELPQGMRMEGVDVIVRIRPDET